jgi:hypothetical protein
MNRTKLRNSLKLCIAVLAATSSGVIATPNLDRPIKSAVAYKAPKELKVFGIFLNEGPTAVQLEVFDQRNNITASKLLSPGEIEKIPLVDGTARVYTPSDSLFSGKLLSRCPVGPQRSASQFFESSSSAFYFRIKRGKITPVRPQDAVSLKAKWQELEK